MRDLAANHETMLRLRQEHHSMCMICGKEPQAGMRIEFISNGKGVVDAAIVCPSHVQGYNGLLHGGFVSSPLDASMAHCLFAYGITAVTAELRVRFRHPVHVGELLRVRAWMVSRQSKLYHMKAELQQGNQIRASAFAKFMDRPFP